MELLEQPLIVENILEVHITYETQWKQELQIEESSRTLKKRKKKLVE